MQVKEPLETHHRLVSYWASVYMRCPGTDTISKHDMEQEGYLGLLRAYELFDPSRECRFSTYASYWIRARIRQFLRRQQRDRLISTPPAILENRAVVDDDVTPELKFELDAAVAHSLGHLTPRCRDVVTALYGIGRELESRKDVAKRLGISRERVRQIQKQAFVTLKADRELADYFQKIVGFPLVSPPSPLEQL